MDPQAFIGVSRSLSHLFLGNNLLHKIPFEALSILKLQASLQNFYVIQKYFNLFMAFIDQNLDLSHNLITSTLDIFYQGKLSITELDMSYNRIPSVVAYSLQNFKLLTTLSLHHNPITFLGDDSFKGANTQNLDISNCRINVSYKQSHIFLNELLINE